MRKLQSQGVHHITLVGADRQTSIDFWEGVLGMPFVFEQPNLDRASESHLYFDPGDGRLITVFTDESRKPDPRRTPTEPGCVHHLAIAVSAATFRQAVERLDERGIEHSGVKDRGFMDSIYFKDPLGLLIELAAYRFEPPWGWTHGQVLMEAHRIRVERGDYAIAEVHLADAIERLSARNRDSLSEDRGPKDPYQEMRLITTRSREEIMKLYMHPASITSRIVRLYIAEKGLDGRRGGRRPLHRRAPPAALRRDQPEPAGAGARGRRLPADRERGDPDLPRREERLSGVPAGPRRPGAGQRGDVLGELQLLPRVGLQPRLPAALPAPQAADRGGAQGRGRVGPRQGDLLAAGAGRPLARRRTDLADRRGDHASPTTTSAASSRSAT